jgi:CDP-glucose 4,6-dehydratase
MALTGQRIINHQAYNFGPSSEVNQTVSKLIEAMSARWPNSNWEENTKVNSSTLKEAKLLMLSCEKARNELNWRPVWGFEETLTKTIDWYHDQATCSNFDAYATGMKQIKQYCIEKTQIAQG